MSEKVYVTSAEVEAARAIVERNAVSGRATPDSVRKIANAVRIEGADSGKTGFKKVTPAVPRTSTGAKSLKGIRIRSAAQKALGIKGSAGARRVFISRSGGKAHRNAMTGGYVAKQARKRETK